MFDYDKFEDDIVKEMESALNNWISEHNDLYIFTLDCAEGMDSIGAAANTSGYLKERTEEKSSRYWYYKYCEEEWELYCGFGSVSEYMRKYIEENEDTFADPETFEYTEAFNNHGEKITEHCLNALKRLKQEISESYPEITLTLYIPYYFDGEGRTEIFEEINGKDKAKEYSEHIKDFA